MKINSSAHFNLIYILIIYKLPSTQKSKYKWVNHNVPHVKYIWQTLVVHWCLGFWHTTRTTLLSVWCWCLWIHESAWYASTGYSGVYMYIALFFVRICHSNLSLILMSKALPWYLTLSNNYEPDEALNQVFFIKSFFVYFAYFCFSSNIQALSYKANS